MGKKMSDPKLDALFEKMSRECANAMNGTHPTTKTATKKKGAVMGTKKKK